jgi:DNA-binding Xre family transcriptional regulator/Mn-dependent DtxR family transcriptional regulator
MDEARAETARIMETLKRVMKSRSMTYADLAQRIELSEASVKRIFSQSTLTLARLDQICQALETSIQEVTRLAGTQPSEAMDSLGIDQEEALAADPNLLACYYLVANGRSGKEIAVELGVEERNVRRWFVRLDALGLITVQSKLRARARTTSAIKWRENGPVRKLYELKVQQEFLQSAFSHSSEAFHFRSSELSESSYQVLLRRLDRLASEFRDLAELDRALPSRDKRSVGLLVAARPWVFSMFASLRRPDPNTP